MKTEHNRALAQLRQLAHPLRFRVTTDLEGFPFIPARYGRIEWFDGRDLAVYCDHPRLFGKLWAIPGVQRHQTGDHEMRAIFPPEVLAQVASVVRAKRWGGSGRGRVENLRSEPGQTGSSQPQDRRKEVSEGPQRVTETEPRKNCWSVRWDACARLTTVARSLSKD